MFLDIHEIERQPIALDQLFPPGRIDFGEDVWQVEPLEVHGRAELVAGEMRLRGDLGTTIEVPCARCLERTRLPPWTGLRGRGCDGWQDCGHT